MEKQTKYILISGATSGFGLATAMLFAQNNWNLILTGRRLERLEKIKVEICSKHQEIDVQILNFDIQSLEQVNDKISSLDENILNQIEILVNNAGLALGRNTIDNGLIDDWNQMIDTNVKGLLYLSKAIIPIFKAKNRGHIINLSSVAGKEVYPEGNVYCASKHAVDALSKAMRIDLVSYGIKVTNIAPGAANTEFSNVRFKGNQENVKAIYNGFEPLIAQDIAETIYFVSTRPSHVNINDITIMSTAQASASVFHKVIDHE